MLEHEYETMRRVEDGHWWYHLLREMTTREVARALPPDRGARLLDAGCGTGGMMQTLHEHAPRWELHGVDFSPLAVEFTRARGFQQVRQGSLDALDFPDTTYDGVISLDVLCQHGLDQERALREFHRTLLPGGFLVLNLPAFDCLRGRHDIAVGAARRYTPAQVRGLLERSGFQVGRVHCWNAWLFPPLLAWRQLSRHRVPEQEQGPTVSDLRLPPPGLNRAIASVGRLDAALCRLLRSPVGTSVFAVARKPGNS